MLLPKKERSRLNRKYYVVALFAAMLLIVAPSVFDLSIIETERSLFNIGGVSVTSGDALVLFGLFASSVSIGLWLSTRKKRGRIR